MPTVSEPQAEQRSWTFARARAAFQRGLIGEATFAVSLANLGLPPCDVASEIALAKHEMRPRPMMGQEP